MSRHGNPNSNEYPEGHSGLLNGTVRFFLDSSFSVVLILISVLIGLAALLITPREEDPQIVVPMADIYVNVPGYSAAMVENQVATPLEKVLYQIDGVEYVYSMSGPERALITVRFHVGQDRERSLVKLYKMLDESRDLVPPAVTGWIVKPVEIDDVPIVTMTLTARRGESFAPRRVAEEIVPRLAALPNVARVSVVGGEPRKIRVTLDPERLQAYSLGPADVKAAIQVSNRSPKVGTFTQTDQVITVDAGKILTSADELPNLVLGVFANRPVFLKDIATVEDGPDETVSYVRHRWGPARNFHAEHGEPGQVIGPKAEELESTGLPTSAVTIAVAKQKGSNAVSVADAVLADAERLRAEVVPDDMELIITRNAGLTSNEKVNELIEALWVAIVIVVVLLTISLGWREALVVAVAVPVVFGLTLGVNLLAGYTINRVTLFALILSLGLLVDDPIVDVENIARHFEDKQKATRGMVMEAVAEIRPPLISATLAVIVSFLPLFFITGMMGPYMAPMALNVPVAMAMSMLVAFTITPWLAYKALQGRYNRPGGHSSGHGHHDSTDPEAIKQTLLYRFFRPLMAPLLSSRAAALGFLLIIGVLTVAATGLAAYRAVPLKMLPFDNKNQLTVMIDMPEGTTLERTDSAVRELERILQNQPEVTDLTAYVGTAAPMDFNGLVRHYYLRNMPHMGEVRVNLVSKKHREAQSHAIALRLRPEVDALAQRLGAVVRVVELPPGPPVLASVVAEVTGREDQSYEQLLAAADVVADRMRREPGLVEVDTIAEAPAKKMVFAVDQEKAAINGISANQVYEALAIALAGSSAGMLFDPVERNPLHIELRLARAERSDIAQLTRLRVRNAAGSLVPLAEIGTWSEARVDQTIYHKNLKRVVYVMAETAGRPPADCVLDILADRTEETDPSKFKGAEGFVNNGSPKSLAGRSFFDMGSDIGWGLAPGYAVSFGGEGEWNITLDVFRDLGLAFGAAMVMIYLILVVQTGSYLIPMVVMLAIPLTVLGVMPGFWLLNELTARNVGEYADPVFFTATAMIGMIALAGIVTRDSIILVDFIELSLAKGRNLFDAIMESRVVRLRPILLTAGAALLSSLPITLDPIFSGLAWSLIFGLVASTIFTLFVIPVTYWLLYIGRERKRLAGQGG